MASDLAETLPVLSLELLPAWPVGWELHLPGSRKFKPSGTGFRSGASITFRIRARDLTKTADC